MKIFDVAIIGSGASGCMCGIVSAKNNLSVALIDKNFYPAKKLMITGNGRCNLTNLNSSSKYYNRDIDEYLKKFNIEDTLIFFNNLGLLVYADEEKRVYPISNSATSVIDILTNEIERLKISVFNSFNVTNIYHNDCYEITNNSEKIYAKNIVIATNICNFDKLLDLKDINTIKSFKSLVALKTFNTKNLSGIRLNNIVAKASYNNQTKVEKGEVLFKDSGLSGIAIFNLSTLFARNGSYKGDVSIDILPDICIEELVSLLKRRRGCYGNILSGIMQKEISKEIFNRCNIPYEKLSNKLTDTEIEYISKTIKDFRFHILDCYDNNQILTGGINLNYLTENLESKKHKGLYFTGEAIDVDGECGGYNLQWAWTSGYIVGSSITK